MNAEARGDGDAAAADGNLELTESIQSFAGSNGDYYATQFTENPI